MITIQIIGQADDAQRAEHRIRQLFNVTSHAEPQVAGDLCLRDLTVEFIPADLLEWHCPLCEEDMPDVNKVGHLMASHNASREWTDWKLNDDAQNIRRLKDMSSQMNLFCLKHETRPEALFAAVRNLVKTAQRLIGEAAKYYEEK